MKKLTIFWVTMFSLNIIFFCIVNGKAEADYKNRIDELNYELHIANEKIEKQTNMLIDNHDNDCYCGWYEDFYYEFADDVGAFE